MGTSPSITRIFELVLKNWTVDRNFWSFTIKEIKNRTASFLTVVYLTFTKRHFRSESAKKK